MVKEPQLAESLFHLLQQLSTSTIHKSTVLLDWVILMSGSRPRPWIVLPSGVSHWAIVSFKIEPSQY